ncbi:NAD(P)-dependent oxidoreductase [Ottowia sp.]|uniref:NAD(P)-dependent oxidoreductase n=1 Tax=Ottowia sp. TaxID=1898956 RepID=UPI0039E25D3B
MLLQDLAADARQWLATRHQVDYEPELADDPALLRGRIYKTQALVVPPRLKINSQLLDFAPRLVAIGRIHDGTDNVDFEACQRRGVRVIQASTATVRASAEYLLSSLLSLYRHGAHPHALGQRAPLGREVNDSVVALLGMTPPAQMLATMLVPLGARVVGYDPAVHRSAELWRRLGVQPMGLNEMLEIADAVSVQLAYATRYRGLVGERVLASCKPGQLWTSIARPALFDPEALAAALRSGAIGAFLMDSDDEALAEGHSPLRGLLNLRITPRVAPLTQESQLRGSWYLADRLHETLVLADADSRQVTPPPISRPAPLA